MKQAHLQALGCFSLLSEAQPGFRKGEPCPQAMLPFLMMLALSQDVLTVGWALALSHDVLTVGWGPQPFAATGFIVSDLMDFRHSLLHEKNMGKRLIFFLFEKYISLIFLLLRGGGDHTWGREWPYHGMRVEVRRRFCGICYLLLLHGFWRLKSGHQADSASRAFIYQAISLAPSFSFLYQLSKWFGSFLLIWTHSPYCPHFPPDSLVNDLLHFHSFIVPYLQLILQILVHTLSW